MIHPLDVVDRAIGEAAERLTCAHHRRRLARLDQSAALDPAGVGRWARTGTFSPRQGNTIEVLVDGAEALPRMAAELAKARTSVHIAGWDLDPDFELVRGEHARTVREILAELAERLEVRVLLWAGPPLPVFRPHRSDVRRTRDALMTDSRVVCALDARERTMHCHHEKVVVIDGRVAFVGGIDLTTLSGDRFDQPDHPWRAHLGWHDAATLLTGPAVADVGEHFRARWQEVTGEPLPPVQPPAPTGDLEVQVVRTVPEKTYAFAPHGEFSILESYLRALRGAQRFIYLENQFLWSPEIVEVLADKLRNPPCPEFRMVLLLPARPDSGKDTTRGQLGELIEADDDGHRLLACTIRSGTGVHADSCYVHAKVGIVDDTWLTIGSANLNEHSLFNDTEMNVVCHDPDLARRTRLRLWSEHLGLPADDLGGDPDRVVDEHWIPTAVEQLRRRDAGEPATHRLLALPAVSRRSARLNGPLRGLLVDG